MKLKMMLVLSAVQIKTKSLTGKPKFIMHSYTLSRRESLFGSLCSFNQVDLVLTLSTQAYVQSHHTCRLIIILDILAK